MKGGGNGRQGTGRWRKARVSVYSGGARLKYSILRKRDRISGKKKKEEEKMMKKKDREKRLKNQI